MRQGLVTNPTEDECITWTVMAAAVHAGLEPVGVEIDHDLRIIELTVRVGWLAAWLGGGISDTQMHAVRVSARGMLTACGMGAWARSPVCLRYTAERAR